MQISWSPRSKTLTETWTSCSSLRTHRRTTPPQPAGTSQLPYSSSTNSGDFFEYRFSELSSRSRSLMPIRYAGGGSCCRQVRREFKRQSQLTSLSGGRGESDEKARWRERRRLFAVWGDQRPLSVRSQREEARSEGRRKEHGLARRRNTAPRRQRARGISLSKRSRLLSGL